MTDNQDLLDHVDAVIWEADVRRGRVTFVSRKAEELFGYPVAEWLANETFWLQIIHSDDRDRAAERRANAIARGADYHIEYRVIAADSTTLWIRDSVRVITEDGRAVQLVGVMADITEWQELQQRENYYRALIANSTDGIVLVNGDGTIGFATDSMEQISGFTPQELVGRLVFDLIHTEDLDRTKQAFQRLLDEPDLPLIVEYRGRQRDGGWKYREVVGVNKLHDPTVGAIVVNVRDVTARKQTQSDLQRTSEQLRHAQRIEAVGRLAGGIAHDFNNLLTAIIGYSALVLQELPLDTPVRRDVEEIHKAGESAGSLTRQLLAFSRRQILQPQIVDLNDVVSRMSGLLGRLLGEQIDQRKSLTTPLARVLADPGQLEQVVMNLALNARDAMPEGGTLTIETGNAQLDNEYVIKHPGSSTGPHVMLAISDTGIGMDATVMEHLFEPFFTTKKPGEGTGLGLATVYGIVKQSGGYIDVASELGRGSTIRVFLPAAGHPSGRQPVSPPASHVAGGTETILVVENQDSARHVTRDILRRHGYFVIEAANATQAIDLGRGPRQVHLLLTDVVMPDLGGRRLAEQLGEQQPGLHVLYMSGHTDDAIVQHGVLDADVAFIQKPFTPESLLLRIRKILDAPP